MNGRIYSEELFKKELEKLKMGFYYCPHCYSNNLSCAVGGFVLFYDYNCTDCDETFNRNKSLTKSEVRNKKINSILKNN